MPSNRDVRRSAATPESAKGAATGLLDPGRAQGPAWTTGSEPLTGVEALASLLWQPRAVLRHPPRAPRFVFTAPTVASCCAGG
eukprot:1058488-Pyramimonas_sp.AAC.1